VTGNVVDELGRPIPGATVRIVGKTLEVETFANARGWFFVDGLPHDDYAIVIEHGYLLGGSVAPDRPVAPTGITLDDRPPYRCVIPAPRTFGVVLGAAAAAPAKATPARVPMIDVGSTNQGVRITGDAITSL
jgi:hypothetical protein